MTTVNERVDIHILVDPTTPADWRTAALASADQEGAQVWPVPAVPGRLGAARALGYAQGTAPLVGFVDDDDLLLPGAVAAIKSALAARPDAAGAFTDEAWETPAGDRPGLSTLNGSAWNPGLSLLLGGYAHHFLVLRRAAIQDVLGELEAWGPWADYVLRGLACRFGPLVHVPMTGYRWRVRAHRTHTRIAPAQYAAAQARIAPILRRYGA